MIILELFQPQLDSCHAEPLLGPLNNMDITDIHWVIVGGESGRTLKTNGRRMGLEY
ncbi:hypothetical protein LSPH24S_09636 [Lysinibacillus sphaericus]